MTLLIVLLMEMSSIELDGDVAPLMSSWLSFIIARG